MQVRPYTDTCNYLGNTICSHDEHVIIDNAITGMNMRFNNLLAEFSHYDSGALSFHLGLILLIIWLSNVEI